MPKITKRLVEAVEPEDKDIILRDSELKGFLFKVTPRGKRTYLLYYRTQSGQERKPVIGEHGAITCEQAREIAKDWLAKVRQGGDPSGERKQLRDSITVKELWEVYLKARKPHLKPSSVTELTRLWEKYILPELGRTKAVQLETATIRRFHEKNEHRPYTANRMLEAVRSIFNHAIESQLLPIAKNPCIGIKKYKEKKRERFLSMEEVARLSDVLREGELQKTEPENTVTLIRLLLLTGCRLGEILNLKWEHVDFEQSCLRLPDSKTGAKMVIIAAPAIELLNSIPRIDGNSYIITGGTKVGNLAPPQKAWRRIRDKAGLTGVRLHDLRHSFASVGASGGLSLPMIGALLGHSQSQTTERYAHLCADPVKQAADMIGGRIWAAMQGKQAEIIEMHKK